MPVTSKRLSLIIYIDMLAHNYVYREHNSINTSIQDKIYRAYYILIFSIFFIDLNPKIDFFDPSQIHHLNHDYIDSFVLV